MAGDLDAAFGELGYAGPVPVLSPEECRTLLDDLERPGRPEPLRWFKGHACSDRAFYALATDPRVLGPVCSLLGDDAILWGASLAQREPGQVHAWHTDIESSDPRGGFVSVWIGLGHTSRESTLELVTRSHLVGEPLQKAAFDRGVRRGEAGADEVLGWARRSQASATVVQPDARDGDAIFFDGRLWHRSHNTRASGRRTALLLQYAAARSAVRIPDPGHLEWPFRFQPERPPVVVVSGVAASGANDVVPPPPSPEQVGAVGNVVAHVPLPLPGTGEVPWRPHGLFRGPTAVVPSMSCHVSVLGPGHSPHPPHVHPEEEILVVLDGEAEAVIAAGPDDARPRVERLPSGGFAYYPVGQHHTIRNASARPVTYLMLKWQGPPSRERTPLGTEVHRADLRPADDGRGFAPSLVVEGPTHKLGKLQAHVTRLAPRAGYEPHADEHDVAILVFGGEIETLGARLRAHDVAYSSAGELHGIRNPGVVPAVYLVFEFHPARRPEGAMAWLRRRLHRGRRIP